MGMQVVLAGTGATAANMVLDDTHDNHNPARWIGQGDLAWVEGAFLWQQIEEEALNTIPPESLLKKITRHNYDELKKAIRMGRPLVAVLISKLLQTISSNSNIDWYQFWSWLEKNWIEARAYRRIYCRPDQMAIILCG